jgi:hypothetical protein
VFCAGHGPGQYVLQADGARGDGSGGRGD